MTMTEWERLLADLRSDDEVDQIVQAAEQLDAVANQSHIPDLYRLIQNDDWFIREAVAVPLARLEGARALLFLFHALTRGQQQGQDNDGLSATIVGVLEEHREACAWLLLSMLTDPDSTRRAQAAWALGWQPPEVGYGPLLTALRDCDPKVRGAAAGSLGGYEVEGIVDALLPLLQDVDEQVRVDVAVALGYRGDTRAIPALQTALHDSSERIRSFAKYALERLVKPKKS
jgi:HEAT repeat protein